LQVLHIVTVPQRRSRPWACTTIGVIIWLLVWYQQLVTELSCHNMTEVYGVHKGLLGWWATTKPRNALDDRAVWEITNEGMSQDKSDEATLHFMIDSCSWHISTFFTFLLEEVKENNKSEEGTHCFYVPWFIVSIFFSLRQW